VRAIGFKTGVLAVAAFGFSSQIQFPGRSLKAHHIDFFG
jgi:hypothetical protein